VADDTRRVYRAVDLALRVGEVVLSSGAGAADVNAAVLSVTRACGLRAVHVDVNFTTLTVSYQSEAEEPPQTYLRTVTYRGLDYGLLTDVDRLVHALVHGEIDPETASRRLNELRSAARPFPRWVVSLSTGLMAAGVGLLLQGRLLVVAIAFATAIGIDQVVRQLACRRIPAFYQQVAGALVASIVAHGVAGLNRLVGGAEPVCVPGPSASAVVLPIRPTAVSVRFPHLFAAVDALVEEVGPVRLRHAGPAGCRVEARLPGNHRGSRAGCSRGKRVTAFAAQPSVPCAAAAVRVRL